MSESSGSERVCIGFGEHDGTCANVIGEADLLLNHTGLWCQRCEQLRRDSITASMAEITKRLSV